MNELFSLWRTSNPIAQWLELSTEREQNAALGGLSPTAAPEQATVTLFPAAGKKFVSTQPADIGVFFSPAGLPASITQWTEERVGVQVPNLAFDGHVYFGYILTEYENRIFHRQSCCAGNVWTVRQQPQCAW